MSKIWIGGSLYFSMTGTRDEEVVARLRRCLGTLLVRDNVTKLCARTTTLSAAAVNGEYDNQVIVFLRLPRDFSLGRRNGEYDNQVIVFLRLPRDFSLGRRIV